MTKLSLILTIAVITAAGALLATGLHRSVQVQSPSTRVASLYAQFKAKFGRLQATPAEDQFRLRVFEKNLVLIDEVNKHKLGYSFAVNDFADMEKDEFAAKYYGLGSWKGDDFWNVFSGDSDDDEEEEEEEVEDEQVEEEENAETEQTHDEPVKETTNTDDADQADEVDWSSDMHPIQQQHACASCYAFSAVVPLELAYLKTHGTKVRLAPQELVDCSGEFGNTGCKGGWMHQAYDYILDKGHLSLESGYPYMAVEAQACRLNNQKIGSLLKSYKVLKKHRQSDIKSHLRNTVVPSAVDCSGLMFYRDGVYDGQCDSNINHAVVIVGFGTNDDGQKYWKVRNSWGTNWGEDGYLRIKREESNGKHGKCGITSYNVVTLQ